MKAIIQRVSKASVTVGDELVSSVGKGLCVLLGIGRDDGPEEVQYMVKKILNLRVFEDDSGKSWNKNVMDKKFDVLCVSQFTLSCILKGNKPDFHGAMSAEQSQVLYASFLEQMKAAYNETCVKDGRFQAYMQVHIQNDGPVTIPLETPNGLKDSKIAVKAAKAQARQPKKKYPSASNDQQKTAPSCEVSEQTASQDTQCNAGASGDSLL